jgi:hypothetical protein
MSSFDVTTIVGFCFFALSEILPFLPIKTNGLLHSFILGFKDGFKNIDQNIDLAQKAIKKKPEVANVVNILSTNNVINDCVNNILENQHVIPQIKALCNNSDLQIVLQNITNNPILLQKIKSILNDNINASFVASTPPQTTPQEIRLTIPDTDELTKNITTNPMFLQKIKSILNENKLNENKQQSQEVTLDVTPI